MPIIELVDTSHHHAEIESPNPRSFRQSRKGGRPRRDTSIATGRPVILEVTDALANTALLALFAVPISFFIGYVMGVVAGCFPGRWLDRVVTGGAVIGVSLPNYWLGIVLVIFFSVQYMLLPATGMGPNGSTRFHIWSGATQSSWCCRSLPWR